MVRFVKKYLVLMVVAVLFVGAFLLNLKTNAAKTGSGEGEALQPPEEAQEGEYVPGDYFATFRDDREQVRKLEMEYLDEVIAASASDDETLADAQGQKLTLVENMEKEFTVESLIKAKGFEDCLAVMTGDNINVIVKTPGLLSAEVAQITEIVMEETGYTPVAHFILPEYCWLDCFYKPMQENIPLFLEKYKNNIPAQQLVQRELDEIDYYQKYKSYYGYVFYIGMKNK